MMVDSSIKQHANQTDFYQESVEILIISTRTGTDRDLLYLNKTGIRTVLLIRFLRMYACKNKPHKNIVHLYGTTCERAKRTWSVFLQQTRNRPLIRLRFVRSTTGRLTHRDFVFFSMNGTLSTI